MSKTPTTVDYESYYDKNLSASDMGTDNYVRESYAYLLSVHAPDFQWVGDPRTVTPKDRVWGVLHDPAREFWAAHSNFDQAWTDRYFPEGVPARGTWQCVLDRGSMSQYPHDVAGLARTVLGHTVDKSLRDWMRGRHWDDLSAEDKKAVTDYCAGDSREESEIRDKLPEMSTYERRLAEHTRMTNRRGICVDQAKTDEQITLLEEARWQFQAAIPWSSGNDEEAPLSVACLSRWAERRGITVPKSVAEDSPECATLMALSPEFSQVVGYMRGFRRASKLVGKLKTLRARVREDGRFSGELIYCGAPHTRRWSSRGYQVHNMEREAVTMKLPKSGQEIRVWPRELLRAGPGKKLLCLDYSQVEPRCLRWLVGDEPLLDMMRKGWSIYEASARLSGLWTSDKPLKKSDPSLYALIKARELGLGYGMGADRFRVQAQDEHGVVLSEDQAQDQVKDWRSRNEVVTKFWGLLDGLIAKAVRGKGDGKDLRIDMPNGELFQYFRCRVVGRNKYGGFKIRGESKPTPKTFQYSLWGGTLTENLVQRMARDLFGEAILRLEDAGLPVAWHVHDEVILELPDPGTPEAEAAQLREISEIMSKNPDWAQGLPLQVEGVWSYHYVK